MRCVETDDLDEAGFCEYETYANFALHRYPDSIRTRDLPYLRTAGYRFGMKPSARDLERLAKDYAYASFENHHGPHLYRLLYEKTRSLLRI